jgi:FtsP/CotA-like multicopper oxidase with cupredoxin domain
MLADKAWDANGQLHFDIFDTEEGFIADVMTVNLVYRPFFEVERRKYRFRILNGAVSRFFKISLSDASPMIQIANDGNLLPGPVVIPQTDQLGIAERYDIVIDFSRYNIGQPVSMVNLHAHEDARCNQTPPLSSALGSSRSLREVFEFRIVRNPATPMLSQVPRRHDPEPDLSAVPWRARTFVFGDGANQTSRDAITSFRGPRGIGRQVAETS